MKCYASDYCQKDKSSCSDVCGGYRVLRALYCSVSNGSACTSKSYSPSYVLEAMGIPVEDIESSVRISWEPETNKTEFIDNVSKMIEIAKSLAV